MKDLSFFLLKNSIGAKMKKGIRNFCNGDGSTSTLNQHHDQQQPPEMAVTPPSVVASNANSMTQSPPTTLEEMILRLELEEELARKAKLNEFNGFRAGRMSCVNNSDILRSARNALNQYPRFSLDGKDAMYRSSFRNSEIVNGGRKSVCCDQGVRERYCKIEFESRFGKSICLPSTVGGESVIWCKPGVVAKLMGLESVPVLVSSSGSKHGENRKQKLSSLIKRQNLRRRAERHEIERRLAMEMSNNYEDLRLRRSSAEKMGSCSKAGYCVMKPVVVEPAQHGDGGWPTRRFL
ncbi:hypothetical protein CCACVL1_22940 [Corchorus capsularis]|uniref:DUF3741 domain-containing protein n=1 Tax=Corchorus capsularis TaxID=210143 RepID=A0A1R3GVY8_COCAP|nr:hypothetical protein CCACVL1_22940 [Corchorus capsularis]